MGKRELRRLQKEQNVAAANTRGKHSKGVETTLKTLIVQCILCSLVFSRLLEHKAAFMHIKMVLFLFVMINCTFSNMDPINYIRPTDSC